MIIFIKRRISVAINIFASSLFFLSIGFFFGFSELADEIFFILAIQSAVGIILQITWHVAIPMIYSKRNIRYKSIIISTALMNLMVLSVVYIGVTFFLSQEYSGFFNTYAAVFALFFQGHLFFKNLSLVVFSIKSHYIFDTLGYFLSFLFICTIFSMGEKNNINLNIFFIILICSWATIFICELYFYRNFLIFRYSNLVTRLSFMKGYKVRFSSLLFSAKDYVIPYILKEYAPVGSITIYSYSNKAALSIFQSLPLNIVNYFYSQENRISKKIDILFVYTARRALLSYIAASFFAILLLVSYYFFQNKYVLQSYFYLTIIAIVFLIYGIQAYEQMFARAAYYCKLYNVQFKADLINSFVFFAGCLLTFYYKSAVYSFLAALVAQSASLIIYKKGISSHYDT